MRDLEKLSAKQLTENERKQFLMLLDKVLAPPPAFDLIPFDTKYWSISSTGEVLGFNRLVRSENAKGLFRERAFNAYPTLNLAEAASNYRAESQWYINKALEILSKGEGGATNNKRVLFNLNTNRWGIYDVFHYLLPFELPMNNKQAEEFVQWLNIYAPNGGFSHEPQRS